jgi:hypothetical protein
MCVDCFLLEKENPPVAEQEEPEELHASCAHNLKQSRPSEPAAVDAPAERPATSTHRQTKDGRL